MFLEKKKKKNSKRKIAIIIKNIKYCIRSVSLCKFNYFPYKHFPHLPYNIHRLTLSFFFPHGASPKRMFMEACTCHLRHNR